VFERAPVGIAMCRDGRYVRVNAGYAQMFGYASPKDMIGLPWLENVAPAFRKVLLEQSTTRAAPERSAGVEIQAQRADGSTFPASVRFEPMLLPDGVASVAFFTDLTESRRADEERERLANQFRTLAEAIPHFVWTAAPRGGLEYVNQRWLDYLGIRAEDAVDWDWTPLVHPDDLPEVIAKWTHCIETGEPFEVEHRLKPAGQDTYRWFLSLAFPMRDASGNVMRWFGTGTDITDRKLTETKLTEANKNLEAILDNIQDAVAVHDPNGNVWFANDRAAQLMGFDSAREFIEAPQRELTGRVTLLTPEGAPIPAEQLPFRIAVSDKKSAELLVQVKKRGSDEALWAMLRSKPVLGPSGDVAYIVSSTHDVTELLRAEQALRHSQEQLRQSQKMEAMGRLAGGVAHDFNNLLTVINAYADMALANAGSDLRLQDYLRDIRGAGERAAGLTAQLLAFSRKQVLESRALDLNDIVSGMERLLRRVIGEDVELVVRLDPDLRQVRVDKGQMEQVLLNLVVNARDAMPDGGKLVIETQGSGARALLCVCDTGVGMPPEVKERIFEPFFTTKPQGEGTGLGLSSVYGIITQSGGSISVESLVGAGTSFRVSLPVTDQRAAAPEEPRRSEHDTNGRGTILVVEDEQPVRRLVKRVLEMRGYRVIDAASGPEALAALEANPAPVQLLITDVIMPKFSGRELAQQLLRRQPSLRVIYMSGYTGATALEPEPTGDGVAFVQKPFSPEQLLRKVSELLSELPEGA
jgi:PAS domain S-box-containing protein